jgi:hypothetical protein
MEEWKSGRFDNSTIRQLRKGKMKDLLHTCQLTTYALTLTPYALRLPTADCPTLILSDKLLI